MSVIAESAVRQRGRNWITPLSRLDVWQWLAVLVASVNFVVITTPLSDPDIWWHVKTGDLILSQGIPHSEPWAWTAKGRPWVPTAWLSDVVLSVTHSLFGWEGILVLKLLLSAALMAVLGRYLFRLAPSWAAALVYALCIAAVGPFMAERPQLISLFFTLWLSLTVWRVLIRGHMPSWAALPITYIWSNVHGMWVLAPLALLMTAICLAVDRKAEWRRPASRCAALSIGSVILACLTPVGPRLAYWPFVVRNAARDISEWQPTEFNARYTIALLLLFSVWVISVARTSVKTPYPEVLWMTATLLFAVQAYRNVAPATILAAPFVCTALGRAFSAEIRNQPSPRVPIIVPGITAALAIAISATVLSSMPSPTPGVPYRIVGELKARGEANPVRVLDTYGVGGMLTGFGAPQVSVAIDGRTDNFNPSFVHRYLATTRGRGDWRRLISDLRPDVAVVGKSEPLAIDLENAGWRISLVDREYVLLDPPRH